MRWKLYIYLFKKQNKRKTVGEKCELNTLQPMRKCSTRDVWCFENNESFNRQNQNIILRVREDWVIFFPIFVEIGKLLGNIFYVIRLWDFRNFVCFEFEEEIYLLCICFFSVCCVGSWEWMEFSKRDFLITVRFEWKKFWNWIDFCDLILFFAYVAWYT